MPSVQDIPLARPSSLHEAGQGVFDLLIIGGGIHGACAALLAARRGYRVLLLEAEDYAQGTSSRSSKLLHGGVRYLEQGDFALVHEALLERSIMLEQAPHLSRVLRFLFPVLPGRTRPAWQLDIGLRLYDFLARRRSAASSSLQVADEATLRAAHSTLSDMDPEFAMLREAGLGFSKVFAYAEAQMDDARIVIETIVAARQAGAVSLNHARVVKAERVVSEGGNWRILALDCLSGGMLQARAKVLLNLAGPWAPQIEQGIGHQLIQTGQPAPSTRVAYSRGTHIVFDRQWVKSGLILPTGEKGRYYFVLPLFSHWHPGVLVGTTDRAAATNEDNPQPTQSEIEELLGYLKRDLPGAGLHHQEVVHAYSGMRILSLEETGIAVSRVSRAEEISEQPFYLTLAGGKYTTARSTAAKIIQRAERMLGAEAPPLDSAIVRLPGAVGWSEETRLRLTALLNETFIRGETPATELAEAISGIVRCLGSRAEGLCRYAKGSTTGNASQAFTHAVTAYLLAEEQAVTYSDIWDRRLNLPVGLGEKLFSKDEILSNIKKISESSGNLLKKEEQQGILIKNNL